MKLTEKQKLIAFKNLMDIRTSEPGKTIEKPACDKYYERIKQKSLTIKNDVCLKNHVIY